LFREWLLSHHAELLARDLTSQVSPWFRQTLNSLAITCPSSSSTTTGLRPMASPSALRSTTSQPTEVGQDASSEKAPELGTLRPALDWPFAFSAEAPLVPFPVSQRRAGTHTDVPISSGCAVFRTAHIHTPVSPPLARLLSFRASSPAYPHDPLVADRLLSTNTVPIRLAAVLGCSTSDLYHLPIMFLRIESLPLAQARIACFARPSVRLLRRRPLGDRELSSPDFGLAIRLVVGGLPPSTLPYHLS